MTTSVRSPIWTTQEPHQIALDALQQFRWSVFPLDAEKRPPITGTTDAHGQPKRLGWKSLQTRRASPNELLYWQKTYQPAAWAIITGAISQIVLLDFDGEAGQETRAHLGLIHPHVQTGSGGHHVYFRHPSWRVPTLNCKTTTELGQRWPGLDIRADGGYAAFCGRNTQGPYQWLRHPEPDDLHLLPDDLRRFLGLLEPPEARMTVQSEAAHTQPGTPPCVSVQTLLTRALHLVHDEGKGRNDAGFWLACQLRDNAYSLASAKDAMRAYVAQVPAHNTQGRHEPYTLEEAFTSVTSAFHDAPRSAWMPGRNGHVEAEPHGYVEAEPHGYVEAEPHGLVQPRPYPEHGSNGASASRAGTSVEPEPLPEILIMAEQLRDVVDQSVAAIVRMERETPTLFIQSARLVRVGRNELGRPLVTQMSGAEVKEVLTHCANFFRLRKGAGSDGPPDKVPTSPPRELAEQILARQTQVPYLPFLSLTAIVETPVIRPDGSVLDCPGYDRATQLYYAPSAGMEACTIPHKPTPKECEAALVLLWSAIGEFPYVSAADKANALGLLLTPIVRPAIKRHVALALIDAPKQGTGKGLLSDVVSIIATGTSAAILTMSNSENELQKSITALLIEGATMITIDNITGRLQSRHLDAVLTSDMWRGRILGLSKMALVPQRATWVATGNNIKIGGDLGRRCYRIRLDAKVSRPFLRKDFTHKDLVAWVFEQRVELVAALLTLARAWYAAGCPEYSHLPSLGTFSGWVKIVGGILEHAGVPGFLSNLEQLYAEADEESAQWEAFFSTWHQLFGDEWVPLAQVVRAITAANDAGSCDENGENTLSETLPEPLQIALKEKPQGFTIRLSRALEKLVDTCFGVDNLRLEKKHDAHNKVSRWKVLRVVAGSYSLPTHVKKNAVKNPCESINQTGNGCNNYPQLPASQTEQNGSSSLESPPIPISPPENALTQHPQHPQLPASQSGQNDPGDLESAPTPISFPGLKRVQGNTSIHPTIGKREEFELL